MKIRPLCIDYHLRAQEIIATERDICARRAALRSLPNPSPPQHRQQCRHRHWNSDADADGVILRPSSGDASTNDDENEFRSTSRDVVTTGEGGNDEPMTMRQAGERPDRLAPDANLLLQSKSVSWEKSISISSRACIGIVVAHTYSLFNDMVLAPSSSGRDGCNYW
jgi:hypothetical protein